MKLLVSLALTAWLLTGAGAAPRPNIVICLVDDLGFSDLGCYGGEIQTPNLDALAARGIRFTQFYNTAKCEETRATLLSGRYFPEVGLGKLANCVTIPEGLRAAGYSTLMTGKWHLSANPLDHGFDRYFGHLSGATNFFTGDDSFRLDREKFQVPGSGFYTTDVNIDLALRFLDESTQAEKPFFLYVAFNAPHYPLHVKEADYRKYEGIYAIGWDRLREERHARQVEMGLLDANWTLSPRPAEVPAWDSLPEAEKKEHVLTMAAYAGMIDCVDQNVGRLVSKLKEMGRWDNTLFLFLSDNGGCPFQRTSKVTREQFLMPWDSKSYWTYDTGWAHASNTPFRLYKRNQHEGGISSPLIAHWPAGIAQPGTISNRVSHLVDLSATCFELAGFEYPDTWEGEPAGPARGVSLSPTLAGQPDPGRAETFFLWGNNAHRALRQGDWKIASVDKGPWELYNLAADRTELHDLAREMPEKLEEMAARWDELSVAMKTSNRRSGKAAPDR